MVTEEAGYRNESRSRVRLKSEALWGTIEAVIEMITGPAPIILRLGSARMRWWSKTMPLRSGGGVSCKICILPI